MDTEHRAITAEQLDSLREKAVKDPYSLTTEEVGILHAQLGMRMTPKHFEWFMENYPAAMAKAKHLQGELGWHDNTVAAYVMGWGLGAYKAFFGVENEMAAIELRAIVNTYKERSL